MQENVISDSELLKSYATEASEPAFAELVKRYVNLVYSAALRITSDAQIAGDVSQEVFLKLSRQAGSLRNAGALPAWLYRVAHTQAVNAIRAEGRHRRREQEAMEMKALENSSETGWESLSPLIDEALNSLDPKEQAAVVMRFFAEKKLTEVGSALGLTEEAARKRVARGLEKLRRFFAKRGMQVSSSTLAGMLAAQCVQAAPVGLGTTLAATCLSGSTVAASSGLFSTLINTFFMTKTTVALAALVFVGAAVTPLVLKSAGRRSPTPAANSNLTQSAQIPLAAAGPTLSGPGSTAQTATALTKPLLERVAALAPLTPQQIGQYVAKNKGSAESLLAAWRASGDKTWLTEAASRFPNNAEVQYAVIAVQALPEASRQWIDAYKAASPNNALGWYFSAQNYLKSDDKVRALQELAEASKKTEFRGELTATLQALEELNLGGGRAADEAKIVAFQTCAQSPELPGLRDLAKSMRDLAQQYRVGGEAASAESIAGMGLVLGAHLSEGQGSQTVINQLVGIAIEKMFLQQLDPSATHDPYGRPVADLTANINQRQATLKGYAGAMQDLFARLDDSDWAVYMERVKLYGEEAALAWLKEKQRQ